MAYVIGDDCIACGTCIDECPSGAISEGDKYSINPDLCTECGTCADVCPNEAICLSDNSKIFSWEIFWEISWENTELLNKLNKLNKNNAVVKSKIAKFFIEAEKMNNNKNKNFELLAKLAKFDKI